MGNSSVVNLIELLKSQLCLFSELRDIMEAERAAIIAWKPEETIEFTKKKEVISHKEHILEEARKTLVKRLSKEYSLAEPTISAIIEATPEEADKAELSKLKTELQSLVSNIKETAAALKYLYNSNLRIINGVYEQLGYVPADKYNNSKRVNTSLSITTVG